jgi:hypothetical protein
MEIGQTESGTDRRRPPVTPEDPSIASFVPRLRSVLNDLLDVQRVEGALAFAVGLAFVLVPIIVYEELPSPGAVAGLPLILTAALTFGVAVASALMASAIRDWIRLLKDEREVDALASLSPTRLAEWSRSRLVRWKQALLSGRDGIIFLGFVLGTVAIPLLLLPVVFPAAPWSSPFSWLELASVFVVPEVAGPTVGYTLVRSRFTRAIEEVSRLQEETDPLDWFVPPTTGPRGANLPPTTVPVVTPELPVIEARLRALRVRLTKGLRRQVLAVELGSIVLAAFPMALALGTFFLWNSPGGLPSEFPTALFVLVLGMPLGALLIGVSWALRASWAATQDLPPEADSGGAEIANRSSTQSELRAVFRLVEQGQRLRSLLVTIAGVGSALSSGTLLLIVAVSLGWDRGTSTVLVLVLGLCLVAGVGLLAALAARAIVTWRFRALATSSEDLEVGIRRLEEDFWSRF